MKSFTVIIYLLLTVLYPASIEAQVINKVVAVVNDEVITQQDIDQLLAVLYAQYVHTYKGDKLLEKMEEVKRDIPKQIVEDKLILSRAKELNIDVTEGEINEKLEYVKSGFPSEGDFYGTLEAQGITLADLKNRYRDQIMMKKIVDFMIRSKVSVLPSEISEYYEEHRPELIRKEQYKVRHILVKAEDEVDFELAKVEVNDIYDRLKSGYDFGELAKEHSQGPNRGQSGDMGYIGRGEMLQEIDEAIFRLKPGEFSGPVKSKVGYHIFKVEDVKNSGYMSLAEVKNGIKKMLFQEKFKEKLEGWLAELRSKAYISIK
ncbi:peptidylprolyl isomerase [Candidatus Omnitrophota bacterium]